MVALADPPPSASTTHDVVVVGAGSAGLYAAKHLIDDGYDGARYLIGLSCGDKLLVVRASADSTALEAYAVLDILDDIKETVKTMRDKEKNQRSADASTKKEAEEKKVHL